MDGFRGFFQTPAAQTAGNEHIGSQRNSQEQIDHDADDRGIVPHCRQGFRPHIPAQDHDVRCIEHLLQDPDERHRDGKLNQRLRQRAFQHIDLRSSQLLTLLFPKV